MIDRWTGPNLHSNESESHTFWQEFAEDLLTRPDEELLPHAVKARDALLRVHGSLMAIHVPDIVSLTASDFSELEMQDAQEHLQEKGSINDAVGVQMYKACSAVADFLQLDFRSALKESEGLTFFSRSPYDGVAYILAIHGAKQELGEKLTVVPRNIA